MSKFPALPSTVIAMCAKFLNRAGQVGCFNVLDGTQGQPFSGLVATTFFCSDPQTMDFSGRSAKAFSFLPASGPAALAELFSSISDDDLFK